MWNPFRRGYSYTALREHSATLPRKFYIRTLAGLFLFSVVVLLRDVPSSLTARDPSTRGLRTVVLGGVPGYLVLENVWYNNHTFYLYNPGVELPTSDGVLSHPGYVAHAATAPALVPDVCFSGTSLVVNENGWSGWHGLWHYYHFAAENIVAGFAALAQAGLHGVPDRLVIPWENNWHDRFGMNEMVIKGLWGMDWEGYVSPDNWRELGRDGPQWFFFEKVAIVDRWVTHAKNPSADQWNKMPMPILETHPRDDFFVPARQRFLDSYGMHPPSRDVPEVLYIDRQNTDRRLPNATHDALLEMMQEMSRSGRFEFKHVELEDLTPREQIEVVAYADIMVGIHGNGLTHEMWMPQRSTLIELFHPTSFLRDYECIGTAIGHHYYAVRNDTVLTPAEWEAHPGEQHSNLMHDGTPINLYLPFFRTVMEAALARYE